MQQLPINSHPTHVSITVSVIERAAANKPVAQCGEGDAHTPPTLRQSEVHWRQPAIARTKGSWPSKSAMRCNIRTPRAPAPRRQCKPIQKATSFAFLSCCSKRQNSFQTFPLQHSLRSQCNRANLFLSYFVDKVVVGHLMLTTLHKLYVKIVGWKKSYTVSVGIFRMFRLRVV